MPEYTYNTPEFNTALIATIEDLLDRPSATDKEIATKLLTALPEHDLMRKFYLPHLNKEVNVPDYTNSTYTPAMLKLEQIDAAEKPLRRYLRGIGSADAKKQRRLEKSWNAGFLPASYKLLANESDENNRLEKLQILATQGYAPAQADLAHHFFNLIQQNLEENDPFPTAGLRAQYYAYIKSAIAAGNKNAQEAFSKFLTNLLLISAQLKDENLSGNKRKNILALIDIAEEMSNDLLAWLKEEKMRGNLKIEPDHLSNEIIESVIPVIRQIAPDNQINTMDLSSFITSDFLQFEVFRNKHIDRLLEAAQKHKLAPKQEHPATPGIKLTAQPKPLANPPLPPQSLPPASSTASILSQTASTPARPLPAKATRTSTPTKSPAAKIHKRRQTHTKRKQKLLTGMITIGSILVGALVGLGVIVLGLALIFSGAFSPLGFAAGLLSLTVTMSPILVTLINVALVLGGGLISGAVGTILPMLVSALAYGTAAKIASVYKAHKIDSQYTALEPDISVATVIHLNLEKPSAPTPTSAVESDKQSGFNADFQDELESKLQQRKTT